jgi:ribosomal protein S7
MGGVVIFLVVYRNHKRKYYKELVYFSFYIIENKTHENEIENVILRAAGRK